MFICTMKFPMSKTLALKSVLPVKEPTDQRMNDTENKSALMMRTRKLRLGRTMECLLLLFPSVLEVMDRVQGMMKQQVQIWSTTDGL